MKRILAALAALWMLCAPSLARADKTMVVLETATPYWSNPATGDGLAWLRQRKEVQATMETMGFDSDVFFDWQVPTINALTGTFASRNYGGLVVVGARFGSNPSGWCSFDSLTLYKPWDGASGRPTNAQRIPMLFFGVPNVSGNGSAWISSSTCSTGTGMAVGAFNAAQGPNRSAFLAGSNLVWKEWDCIYQVPRHATPPPGILRTIVGFKMSDAANYRSGGEFRCLNCDDVGSTTPATSDSLGIVWARYIDAAPTSLKQTMIFAWPTANTAFGGGTYSQAAMCQALAALDSVSGGKLAGKTPGWEPTEMALVIGRGFSESRPTTSPTPPTNYGGFAREGNPDSTRSKTRIADMGTWGARFTVTAAPDSMIANRGYLQWWDQLKNVQYAVEVTNGTWTLAKLNATSKYATNDPFGRLRARAIGYFGNPMADNDTTMQALLRFARMRVDSIAPGRASRAVFPCNYDGIPSNFALRQLPNIDTYNMALWTAGYRVIVWAPDMANSNPGMTWGRKGQATQSDWATDNYAFGSAEVRYNVYSDSTARTRIGSILHAQCPTGLIAEFPSTNFTMSHNAANDFLQGVFTKIGLSQDYQDYYHSFRQPRRIFRVEAYSLGAQSDSDNPNAYGYWQMKQVVMSMQAVNKIAGRELVRFVYAGDL